MFDDIQPRRRSKLLMNASWNPICALAQSSDVQFMASSPGATNFVWEVMLEVVKIAQALGYAEITEKDAAYQLERAEVRTKANVVEPSIGRWRWRRLWVTQSGWLGRMT